MTMILGMQVYFGVSESVTVIQYINRIKNYTIIWILTKFNIYYQLEIIHTQEVKGDILGYIKGTSDKFYQLDKIVKMVS